ncbi:hypothetical protein QA089_003610 [Meyerozyma guilliermondii]
MAEPGSRQSRDLSFKHRFRLNFGFDQTYYDQCLAYKEAWQDKLFYVDEDILQQQSQFIAKPLKDPRNLDVPDTRLQPLQRTQLSNHVSEKTLEIELSRNNKSTLVKIPFGEGIPMNQLDRKGFLLNTGGQITSMKWLPRPHTTVGPSYLAVSVVSSSEGVEALISHKELGIFNTKVDASSNKMVSSIQIWKDEGSSITLDKVYVMTKFGAVNQLSFLPFLSADPILGILGGLCADGRLRFLKISTHDKYAVVESPSLVYELLDYRTPSGTVSFTSYDYLGPDKIIGGFSDGSMAEFIIPNLNDSLYNTPSYVQAISDTAITAVSVAEPTPGKFFVSVNTTGSLGFVFEYGNFVHGRVDSSPTNSFLKPVAHPFLKIFVSCDSTDSISYSFVRHPQEKSSSVLKVDGAVTALHTPEFVGHPLALCGTSFGEVHVINVCRKILNGTKSTSKTLVPMRLWKLWKEDDTLKLYGDFDVVPSEKVTRIAATPTDIVFSSLAWNETILGGATYAAGTLSGLLVVERLVVK